MPVSWCLAHPEIGEREVLAALLNHNHHLIRDGQILLADKGFSGKAVKQPTEQMALRLLRPDRKDEAAAIWHNWTTGVTSKRSGRCGVPF